jgi:hypothetical protein
MISDQQKLFQYLVRNPEFHPIGFETWVAKAAQIVLSVQASSAETLAIRRKQRLWTEFRKYDQELGKRGCLRIFEVVDEPSMIFCSPKQSRYSEVLTSTLLRNDRHRVISWIDTLNDREFEFLGAATAYFLGARQAVVTPRDNDGGVDFYALLPSWGASVVFHSPHKYIKVVGQSKYYTSQASTDVTKLLVKTIDDIRSFTVEMVPRLPDWFKEEKGPVVGIIVAPFGFQSGAVTRAHSNGIMLADSIDVAEAIICSRRYKRRRSAGVDPLTILEDGISAVGWRL